MATMNQTVAGSNRARRARVSLTLSSEQLYRLLVDARAEQAWRDAMYEGAGAALESGDILTSVACLETASALSLHTELTDY